ncbi:MAG TPA: sodium:solute symporter [Spirochaetota bacterium]|nr:sodium:solute symporter [Spirochaetota bacterium]
MHLDIVVIAAYLVAINVIGLYFAKSGSMNDYFLGARNIPWPVACLSIVATETSTLTFISIPGLAYATNMGFLQIAFGYLIGRVLVAVFMLPQYFQGNFETVYQFIQNRFGVSSRRIIAIVFHVTRLLADSVRLFATAIPLTLFLGWPYWVSILVIGASTVVYTLYGGIRSVAVTDAIQFFLYLSCACVGLIIICDIMGTDPLSIVRMVPGASLTVFSTGLADGARSLFGSYNIISGLVGGAFLSFASHGTDHLIVQRALICRDLPSAKKAMIGSGVLIILQFALFLVFGLFIKALLEGRPFERSDEVLPFFIIPYLPEGLRGLMLAGIFAAAMSTLSASINSLASSTSLDILALDRRDLPEKKKMRYAKGIALLWSVVVIGISLAFRDTKSPLVEIGLSIASITYGGMMGMFLIGRVYDNFSERAAIGGMLASIAGTMVVVFATKVFWVWYVVIGFAIAVAAGVAIQRIAGSTK